MEQNYKRINENTHLLCRGLQGKNWPVLSNIVPAVFDMHLIADVQDVRQFYKDTTWLFKYRHCFSILKDIAYQSDKPILSQKEYTKMITTACMGRNDELFKEHAQEFLKTELKDWAAKVKELKAAAHFKDVKKVDEHLQYL